MLEPTESTKPNEVVAKAPASVTRIEITPFILGCLALVFCVASTFASDAYRERLFGYAIGLAVASLTICLASWLDAIDGL